MSSTNPTSAQSDISMSDTEANQATPAMPEPNEDEAQKLAELTGIHVTLLTDSVRVHGPRGNYRDISYQDFLTHTLKVFKSLGETAENTRDYILPDNTYLLKVGINDLIVCQYYPETKREVTYLSSTRLSVVPNIITTIKYKRAAGSTSDKPAWKHLQTYYFATSLPFDRFNKVMVERPDAQAKISILPFPNVYSEGNLCFGDNFIPRDIVGTDLRPLNRFHDVLWCSPFNNDLGVRATGGNHSPPTWMQLLADRARDNLGFPYQEIGIAL